MRLIKSIPLRSANECRALVVGLMFLTIVTSCGRSEDGRKDLPLKSQQYFVQGEKLFITHCSNCHQIDGRGLGALYPPLNKSDFMENNYEKVICLIKNGIEGELIVNGKQFNKKMEGISSLTDLEITEIATYIYNKWEPRRDSISLNEVSRILNNCQ